MKFSIIPDIQNISETMAISEKYDLRFEYNDFTNPSVYSDEKQIDHIIEAYKALDRDRSFDTMHGAFLGIDIAAVDPVMREYSQKLCKQSLGIAQKLGIKGVVFHTGLIGTLRVDYYIKNWIDTAVDFFTSLCKEYADIDIYMENSFEQEPTVFVELMRLMVQIPNFKLCLDYSHAILTKTPIDEWVEAFKPYVAHMHLNDNDLTNDLHLAVGDGKIDFNEWLSLVNEIDYNHTILLEMNGFDKVEKSLKYVSNLALEIGRNERKTMADNNKLQKILDIGISLSKERNPKKLLSYILDSAMQITNCDGGSLYILKDDGLHFAIMKTISKGVNKEFVDLFFGDTCTTTENSLPPIPLKEANVCAYVAIHKKSLNIADVYDSNLFDFSGPKSYDEKNEYRTKSMVAIPMIDHRNEVIGVMQLINALDDEGNTIDFSTENERIISSLASQTAICLSNMTFMLELDRQMWSFTEALTEVIDMRTPYNGNHTKNVAKYVEMIARYVNKLHESDENEMFFSEEHIDQLVMAAYLHDIGKMITPVKVMNKESRLQHQIKDIRNRFETAKLQYEIALLKDEISKEEYDEFLGNCKRCLELAEELNSDKPLTDEQSTLIDEIEKLTYKKRGDDGRMMSARFFTAEELNCMRIRRGTLTDEERQIMQDHVTITGRILEKVYFNRSFKMAPIWATQHHECIDGTGYPNKLADEELGIEARILAVADICDALLATDRPYKKPLPKEKAFAIMRNMAAEGKLDIKCVEYLEACLK